MRNSFITVVCLLLISVPGHSQLIEHNLSPDATVKPGSTPQSTATEEVDTTGIWYHLHRQDFAAAQAEYQRLQERYPDWQPDPALLKQLTSRAAEPAQATEPAQAASTAVAGEQDRLQGWRLLSRGQAAQALEAFARALAEGAGKDARYGRIRALLALGRIDQAAQDAERFGFTGGIADELHGHYVALALEQAAADPALAMRRARQAATYGTAPWNQLGWAFLEAGHSESAIDAFRLAEKDSSQPRSEALYGLSLAYRHNDDLTQALDIACTNIQVDSRLADICSSLLLETAGAAAAAEDWAVVLDTTTRQKNLGLATPDSEMLRGWAFYHGGEAAAARDLFAERHLAAPSEASAEALLLATLRTGSGIAAVEAYVQGPDDPLRTSVLPGWKSDVARSRGLFIAAETFSPGRHATLKGVDRPYIAIDIQRRDKDGEPGQGRIDATTTALRGGFTYNGHAVSAGINTTDFRSDGRNPVRSGDDLYEPWVAWSLEGAPLSLSARLGTTALNRDISALPVGSVGLRYDSNNALTGVRLFSESKRESLLAIAGQEDPFTGRLFGRVVESGLESYVTWLAAEKWGVSAGMQGSVLTGKHVEDNQRLSLSLAANYEVAADHFDYLRIGPYLNWQRHNENLSHYTFGHGGYYSPQHYIATGLQLDALTTEGDAWLLGLRTSTGWMSAREDAADFYPFGAPTPSLAQRYDAVNNNGFTSHIQMRGGVLLGESWLLTGLAGFYRSPDYRESALSIGLTFVFGGRSGVLRTDLPELELYRR